LHVFPFIQLNTSIHKRFFFISLIRLTFDALLFLLMILYALVSKFEILNSMALLYTAVMIEQ